MFPSNSVSLPAAIPLDSNKSLPEIYPDSCSRPTSSINTWLWDVFALSEAGLIRSMFNPLAARIDASAAFSEEVSIGANKSSALPSNSPVTILNASSGFTLLDYNASKSFCCSSLSLVLSATLILFFLLVFIYYIICFLYGISLTF